MPKVIAEMNLKYEYIAVHDMLIIIIIEYRYLHNEQIYTDEYVWTDILVHIYTDEYRYNNEYRYMLYWKFDNCCIGSATGKS